MNEYPMFSMKPKTCSGLSQAESYIIIIFVALYNSLAVFSVVNVRSSDDRTEIQKKDTAKK